MVEKQESHDLEVLGRVLDGDPGELEKGDIVDAFTALERVGSELRNRGKEAGFGALADYLDPRRSLGELSEYGRRSARTIYEGVNSIYDQG